MPTANRREFVPLAVECFLDQTYAAKELIVIDDGEDCVEDLLPCRAEIRYVRPNRRLTLGAKRNWACDIAQGDIILHWDDDDWYAPWRVFYQVSAMERLGLDICGLSRAFFVNPSTKEAWEYLYPSNSTPWLCGATLCYTKSYWRANHFKDLNRGEDTRFVFSNAKARVGQLDDTRWFIGRIHARNTCPKVPRTERWHTIPYDSARNLVGARWATHFGPRSATPKVKPGARALISAAAGIGDVLRVTPLIRVAHEIGYIVDALIGADNPAASELLEGAPEINRLIRYPSVLRNRGAIPVPELSDIKYEIATFTRWSQPLSRWTNAVRTFAFEPGWLRGGDSANVAEIARKLGWPARIPAPFAVKSKRKFCLPPETIAIHPGCNPGWPWKKWHGFDRLAALLPRVALVGTESDLENSETYFGRGFIWPHHAKDFIGKLSLKDTAALISECTALISPDSGLMHLGVALGVPTFGVFGITNPERECIPSDLMNPITKGLSCEAPCRRKAWGRRDCEFHLECLKTLSAEEVARKVLSTLASEPKAFVSEDHARLNRVLGL